MSAPAPLPAEDASAARTDEPSAEGAFRPGRIILIRASTLAGWRTEHLFGPSAADVARAICDAVACRPGALVVRRDPVDGWPVHVARVHDGEPIALVAAEPPADALAPRLAAALRELAEAAWFPSSLIAEIQRRLAEEAAEKESNRA